MKTYFGSATKYQNLLNIVLSLAMVFAVALAVSCQSPTAAPVPPTGGDTPLAPTTGEPEPATPLQIEVIIQGSTFIPDHTVTARDNSFDSGNLSPGDTFRYTFEQLGELEYYCKIHPSMVGKITVE
jgi:hypothetical protein